MGKLFKWLLRLLVLVVLLIGLGVAALYLLVDEQQVKAQISKQFEQNTGRSLALEGPLEWSVFPWLGARLEQVTIGNDPAFGQEPLAKVQYLDIKVGVKPILNKRVAVDTVVLHGVTLNLQRNSQGRGNWESLMQSANQANEQAQQKPARSSKFSYQVELKGLEFENVNLHWRDAVSGQNIELTGLSLRLGELLPGKPVPVEFGLKVRLGQPSVELDLTGESDLTYSADFQNVDLDGFSLNLGAQGSGLPEQGLKLNLSADIRLDRRQDVLALSDLSLRGHDVDITGDLSVERLSSQPLTEIKLHLQQTSLRRLLALAGIELNTADPLVLTELSGELFARQQGQGLNIDPLKLRLDQSNLTGRVNIKDFNGPVLSARLNLDGIDLDRYLPAPGGQPADPGEVENNAKASQAKPAFEALRRLDLDIQLNIGELKLNNMRMQKVHWSLDASNGLMQMKRLSAELYQGSLKASGQIDVRKAVPRFQINNHLDNIQAGPLLTDLMGSDHLTGTGSFSLDLNGAGLDSIAIRRSLDGHMKFDFRDGSYKGVNLAQAIRQAWATLKGQPFEANEPLETDFAQLSGSARITKGVIVNRDLYLASPIFRVEGQGKVDLPLEQIDYVLDVKIVGSLEGQNAQVDKELLGAVVPVTIEGKLSDPDFGVDLARALQANAETKLKQKAVEKIEEKLGKDVIKSFLGQ